MKPVVTRSDGLRVVIAPGSLALVTCYEGTVPVLPDHDHGPTAEVQRDATGSKLCIRRNNAWTHHTRTDSSTTGRRRRQ